MSVIGIDLGTTNSAAATGGQKPMVLPTRAGEQLTPSVVSFARRRRSEEGEIVVGRPAVANAVKAPEDTIYSIKRLMGAIYGEERVDLVRRHVNYAICPPPSDGEADQGVKVMLGGKAYSPTEISAMILSQVKADAETALGEAVTHAVITVPAYFRERQRAATAEAGEMAGLRVLKIIDEPTAAALAFGAGREHERHRVLVYDLGGGTFDISIIQMVGGQYQVLEIQGDNWLGGDDFDATIVQRMVDWVKSEYDYDPSGDPSFRAKAKEEAQKAKIALSTRRVVEIFAPLFVRIPEVGLVDLDMQVTLEEFEADIAAKVIGSAVDPDVVGTMDLVHTALRNQNLTPDDITEVLLVGGSTAVPLVQRSVIEVFGEGKVRRHINPMECVALGAAIMAEGLPLDEEQAGEEEEEPRGPVPVEVTPMHLGIAAVKGSNPDAFVPIIPKGTPYPLREPRRRPFRPAEDNQSFIRVPVYEGLNELASLNELQGVIEFPLPQGISASNTVEVSFNYDHNRILTVGIHVLGTDLRFEQPLRRDRARPVKPKEEESLLDDWREDLQPTLRAARHFLDSYGRYMVGEDLEELQEGIRSGEAALAANDEMKGRQAINILHNKIMGSGTASQLFIAERAMQNAPVEITQQLAMAVMRLREAHEHGDNRTVDELSAQLRLTVAQLMARRAAIRDVEDREAVRGLLREWE